MEDNKKLRALIRACWFVLITIWLICFISGEKLNIIIQNEKLIEIGNFIDSNIILRYGWSLITYYFNMLLIVYAIVSKKIWSFKPIKISLCILLVWSLKLMLNTNILSSFIDFGYILLIIIISREHWLVSIIDMIKAFIFSLICMLIKNYNNIYTGNLPSVVLTTMMIDYYILFFINYLYARKEGNRNVKLGRILWKNKDLENRKWHFSDIISSCRNNYRSFISCLKTDGWKIYCSIIFFIITYGSILIVGYFLNRIIEATIAVICFHIFRKYDKKTYHADTSIRCWLVSFISFGVLTKLTTPITHSIFVTIMLSYLLTKIMYYTQELIEHLQDNKITKDLVRLENMSKEQLKEMFSEYSTNDINAIYMCLHKDRSTNYEYIAYKHSMSRMTLYRIMKKIRSQYNSLYNK